MIERRLHTLDGLIQAGEGGTVTAIFWEIACYPNDATRLAKLAAGAERAVYVLQNARRTARRGITVRLSPPPGSTT